MPVRMRRQIVGLVHGRRYVEGRIVDIGIEVDVGGGVVGADTSASIDLAAQPQVRTEFQRMVIPLVGEIVDELPRLQRSRVAEISRRNSHRDLRRRRTTACSGRPEAGRS